MTIRTLAANPGNPEDLPPCHGLGRLYNSGRVKGDLLAKLLAGCQRCHLIRVCAQAAVHQERSAGGAVTGIWGGVYITAPSEGAGPKANGRLAALAQLEVTANQPMAVAR